MRTSCDGASRTAARSRRSAYAGHFLGVNLGTPELIASWGPFDHLPGGGIDDFGSYSRLGGGTYSPLSVGKPGRPYQLPALYLGKRDEGVLAVDRLLAPGALRRKS
jgi:hypothetical protein